MGMARLRKSLRASLDSETRSRAEDPDFDDAHRLQRSAQIVLTASLLHRQRPLRSLIEAIGAYFLAFAFCLCHAAKIGGHRH